MLWEQVMKKYYGLLADAFEYYGKHTAVTTVTTVVITTVRVA